MTSAAAAVWKSCSMDSRRVAERAVECVVLLGDVLGVKADAVASDAIRAIEVFILLYAVLCHL